MNAEHAWQAALGELQLQLTKATFDTWVRNTHVISFEDGSFLIGVRNAYAKDWLENRLLTTIKRTLIGIVGQTVNVKFAVRPKAIQDEDLLETMGSEPTTERATDPQLGHTTRRGRDPSYETGLNPAHTFDNFIVGSSNLLAHAASKSVAENPGKSYNPLFLYGGVGLGKTHLLHAIGNLSLAHTLAVLYVSSETFTNDLINAIRTHSTDDLRAKYRDNVDVLLIDDVQFIAGKESTQEELFHTFNTLYEAGKQIVISSDRTPRAISTLEERLKSRFEWGLIADIQPPDYETRTAILRAKAESEGLPIPPDVLDFVAEKFQNNIRELEGALNRIVAHARLMNVPFSVEAATTALQDILSRGDSITSEQILKQVATHYAVAVDALIGRSRSHEVALARQVTMYLLREQLHTSYPQIGKTLGGRDHTTVMYGCDKITTAIEEDDQLRRDVVTIRERLYREPAAVSH
jgi:chromosomal replication initiator protein